MMLASMFLLATWLDHSQTAQLSHPAYLVLVGYALFAVVMTALTWRNWWLDARLAVPAHLVDMAVFMVVVFSASGYTSPFFIFFILPLLSAAIRWGWRETLMTAMALIIVHLTGGLLVAESQNFEVQRFIVRSSHLLILSLVLVWFGVHQQFTRLFFGMDELDRRIARDEDPLPQALALAMAAARANSGALLVGSPGDRRLRGVRIVVDDVSVLETQASLMHEALPVVMFDLDHNRALTQRGHGWYRFAPASKLLDAEAIRATGAVEGFVAQIRSGTRHGWLVLWDVAELSVDFLDLGVELASAAGAVLDHDALLSAIEEGAAARTRLSLARDVHDSVVQFLAGATFRVEAIIRSARSAQVKLDLQELKRLLIEEQGEIRSFMLALRRDRELELTEAVEELKALARRLGKQWSIDCSVAASSDSASVPIKLQLDLQQLLREAVANAVKHGGANRVDVDVDVDGERLRMQVADNGSGFIPANGAPIEPWSLKERVDRARGSLSLYSEPGRTNIVITLPLNGVAA